MKLIVKETEIHTDKECEFLNFTSDYVQGPDEELCREPAPYLLCYYDDDGDDPAEM